MRIQLDPGSIPDGKCLFIRIIIFSVGKYFQSSVLAMHTLSRWDSLCLGFGFFTYSITYNTHCYAIVYLHATEYYTEMKFESAQGRG